MPFTCVITFILIESLEAASESIDVVGSNCLEKSVDE